MVIAGIMRNEGYYANVFYSAFVSLGLDLELEASNNAMRWNLALRFNDQIYLFGFKLKEVADPGSALKKIKDQGYANKLYRAQGLPIHQIGVDANRERSSVFGLRS